MSDDLTNNLLKTIRRQLGDRWDALSVADRQLVAEVAADASGLQLSALAVDPNDLAAVESLKRETAQIDAQLANLQSVAAEEVRGAFWQGFSAVGQVLLHVGLAAVGVNPGSLSIVGDAIGLLMDQPAASLSGLTAAGPGVTTTWREESDDTANGRPNLGPPPAPEP
jgi:hypothetical protein